ncbi:ATP-binding protein [Sporosarcina siberiensis]|uniref:histidine kinase n=1 Tax=Sporosarcina siberiensis TaxID=1365606 RepID=A0ABW4SCY7_9BACL
MVAKYIHNIKLQTKIVMLIFSLFLMIIIVLGTIFNTILSTSIEEHIGLRALDLAVTVASMPSIRDAFDSPHPEEVIQPFSENLRMKTGAEFIVIGNMDSIRYSHPNPDQVGKKMVGGDNALALEDGISYISQSEGTLGPSLRGKAPILNETGQIIGLVSVGFLNINMEEIIQQYENKIILTVLLFLAIAIIASYQIAKGVKKAIFGLEPKEIGRLFEERSAILQSVHEGIIAINDKGNISMINDAAYTILGIQPREDILQTHILEVLPNTKMLNVLTDGETQFNKEMMIGDNHVIASRVPIITDGKVTGVVSSFRKKTDIEQLSNELSQVQQYAEVLRSQTHEYSNKLHTISGLIQLGSYQEALGIIIKETSNYEELIHFLLGAVPDTLISAFLLGKYTRAHELKVNFIINKDSSLGTLPKDFQREKLVTILGNLLDNSFEATLVSNNPKSEVHLFMTDLGNDFIFEIEDSGVGIEEDMFELIFDKGFSTKNEENRGFGLYLVKESLKDLNGYITVSKNEMGGVVFVVVIPKTGGNELAEDTRTHNGR